MNPDFLTFQQFNDPALAEDFVAVLTENNILHEVAVEENIVGVNPLTALNNEVTRLYTVKISADDFNKVNQLLKTRENQFVEAADPDHYLFTFTNEELIEVLQKADEWSSFDYELARKILSERGVTVDAQKIAELDKERIAELKAPEKSQNLWIVIGYLCAVLGGILGIFIGWHLFSSKKTLPDGEQVYSYQAADRKHGKIIFYLSLIGFLVAIILRFRISLL